MSRQRWGAIVGLAVLLGACAAGVLAPAADGAKEKKAAPAEAGGEPGGTAEAARLAAQDPDEYAWQLFLFINRQALPRLGGTADPRKPGVRDYEDNGDVVWESWALASTNSDNGRNEVFLAEGAKPVPWDKLPRGTGAPKMLDHTFTGAGQRLLARALEAAHTGKPMLTFPFGDSPNAEIRMNRPAFDLIRGNELYNREGLAAAFQKARAAHNRDYLQFKPAAKVIKAAWRVDIAPADKPRYHWRTFDGHTYGLVAFHVTTKDLPFWFWCDFIHADLEPNEPPDSARDSTTRGPCAAHGKDGVRAETVGSKWQYYRLKGSQIAFTDARGTPTVLGNQLIESKQADRSSCITCHAMAGMDGRGAVDIGTSFFTGLPRTQEFGEKDILRLQTDFLYSFFRARGIKD